MKRAGKLLAAAASAGLLLGAPATTQAAPPHRPHPHARAWIVVELSTGSVATAHGAARSLAIASTTKLMTALIALERLSLGQRLRAVAYRPTPAESVLGLRRGERITVRDLLRALLLPSANDAAVTLARRIGHSSRAFVGLMNARAGQVGLTHTHYANPVGLDATGNYSSAHDLVRLATLLLRNKFFAHTVARSRATLTSGARRRVVVNRNRLVGRTTWVRGVKTGHTRRAGYVLVGLGRRHGVEVLSAVLGEPSERRRDADTLALLRYGLASFRRDPLIHRGEVVARAGVRYRPGQHVDLVAERTASFVARAGERPSIELRGVPRVLTGPLPKGTAAGTAVVHVGGRELARVPLVTARPLPRVTLGQRLGDYFSRPLTLLLLVGFVGCSLLLVLLRRRVRRRRRRRARPERRPRTERD